MFRYRAVFAWISPYFVGSPSHPLGRASISRRRVEIQAVSGAGGVGLCGRASPCVERTDVGGGRVPTRLRLDLARFWRIPLAGAREGLDLATSGRDPGGFGGRGGRVVRPCVALRRAHRRGRGAGTEPSSPGSRLILWDPPRTRSGGPRSSPPATPPHHLPQLVQPWDCGRQSRRRPPSSLFRTAGFPHEKRVFLIAKVSTHQVRSP